MSKLLIYKVERKEDKNENSYFTLHLKKEAKPNMLSVARYKTNVFDSADTGALYASIEELMGTEDEKVFEPSLMVEGEVAKMKVPKHYYFSTDKKGKVVVDEKRIVQFVRVVALDGDTVDNQVTSYLNRVPKEAFIKEESDDDEEEDD